MKLGQLFLFLGLFLVPARAQDSSLSIQVPSIVLRGVPFTVTVTGRQAGAVRLSVDGVLLGHGTIDQGDDLIVIHDVLAPLIGNHFLEVQTSTGRGRASFFAVPGAVSILPPLMAITLALITKQVILSLFCGVWLGAVFTMGGYNPLIGFLRTIDSYLIRAITDPDHMAIVLFTMTLGGMVGIISRSGGTQGIVVALARYAHNRRQGQLATWLMGLLIFFDDYSNSLLVGNTMRPFTDKLKISREKLSYMVNTVQDLIIKDRVQLNLVEVDVLPYLNEVCDSLVRMPALADGIELILEEGDAARAWLDPARVEWVITDLVKNAAESFSMEGPASPKRKSVTLSSHKFA
ncbi:MAG: hypothetical protein IIC41_01020, partial [Candidatus Marinimicrobia bacterium]|nr:hypothetical protein [Candidatus Neomarinimicrobiota bacterium]